MKVLFINIPSRPGPAGQFVPLGPLYAAGAIMRAGHDAKIIDPYLTDNLVEIDGSWPDVIGFGGIASSYGKMKRISVEIKKQFPEIIQIVGGPLASVHELITRKTPVDAIFHGEAELSLPHFLKAGVIESFPQITDLDTIPIPPYHLIDVMKYIDRDHPYFPVMTSRGCTNKCSFCYRHMQGYRQHSVRYVMDHLDFLNRKYGITRFNFSDELFNRTKEWVMELCKAMKGKGFEYQVAGARVNTMDGEMLAALKESGCVWVAYGQESGSDRILKEYHKGTTVEMNRRVTLATRAVGIGAPVQLVIGGPTETSATIQESIQFLHDTRTTDPSINYLVPFPETPIWKYVMDNKLIPDVERYLDTVADKDGSTSIVNLTKEPYYRWRFWAFLMKLGARRSRFGDMLFRLNSLAIMTGV